MINIRSKVKSQVLNYFFLNEDREVYINDLARRIDVDSKTAHWALQGLEELGLLKSEFRGKERYFSLNKTQSLYQAYREIFLKTKGIEHVLKEKLAGLKGLQSVYIYGSYAKGKITGDSDIDLLMIGRHSPLEAQKKSYALQKAFGREINIVHLTPEDFRKKKRGKNQFISGIFSGPTIRIL